MKNFTSLNFIQIIMVFFLTTLFFSCDLDTSKLTQSNASSDPTSTEASAPTSAEIGDVDIAFCDTNVDNRHGCTCKFQDASGNGAYIFISNMDQSKSACLSINGKPEILTGKRIDARHDHFKHSHMPEWIILDPDGDVHIFNTLVDDANYEANKDLIVQTMLVMKDLPTEIKWRKNTDPNGDEVSAELSSKYEKMWSESLAYATEERAKGNHGEPLVIELSNATYDATLMGNVEEHNEDGFDHYKGTIEIKSKSGDLLGSREFMGICECED